MEKFYGAQYECFRELSENCSGANRGIFEVDGDVEVSCRDGVLFRKFRSDLGWKEHISDDNDESRRYSDTRLVQEDYEYNCTGMQ